MVTTSYYLGGSFSGRMATREGTTLTYIHQDSLSSTSLMSTSTGTLDNSMTFFPFGGCRFSQGTLGTDKKFTGQRLDGTGLYYYNARYYDASIGRFISPDTVVQSLANPQTLNRYSYCVNNPLKYTDPSGNDQIITTGGVNDNGETWYTICDGQGNLLAIATGIDDLAQKMQDCEAVSNGIDLPLGKGASDFFDAINNKTNVATAGIAGITIDDAVNVWNNAPPIVKAGIIGAIISAAPYVIIGGIVVVVCLATPSDSSTSNTAVKVPDPGVAYPCENVSDPPGPGYEWRGGEKGSWDNPETGENLRPDLGHGDPYGPHWDYKDPNGKQWRWYPDGHLEPK